MPAAIAAASSNSSGQTTFTANQPPARCGATVADAVKQAQLYLREKGAEHAALECLTKAVGDLEKQSINVTRTSHVTLGAPGDGPAQ